MRDDPADAADPATEPATGSWRLRCSSFARAEDVDPVGSAGSYRGIVLAEIPLPWPRDIAEHRALAMAAGALAGAGMRLQGLMPDERSDPRRRRLMAFTRPGGAFDRYRGRAWPVADDHLGDAVVALARSGGSDAGPAAPRPGVETGSDVTDIGRHVLVCTHGGRDACCGSFGTRLTMALPALGAAVRVWRTSHTGGHRFAPTALLLPEGTMWAYLDVERLVGISDRTLAIEEAASLYRGCAGLDGPQVQAAEREALRSIGWSWFDYRRRGRVLESAGGRSLVRIDAEAPGGRHLRFEATVEVARVLPVPDCGRPPEEAAKSAPELRVTGFAAA
jgi:hypothetical protein